MKRIMFLLCMLMASTVFGQTYTPVKATSEKGTKSTFQCTGHTKKVDEHGYYVRCKNKVDKEGAKCHFHKDQK